MGQDDQHFLGEAIAVAARSVRRRGGGPFGAIIVRKSKVISVGRNTVVSSLDPTAHAEIVAIRRACRRLESFHLRGCVLYSSCEPCPMCLAAAYWSRLDRICYGADREDAEAAGFDDRVFYETFPRGLPAKQMMRKEAQEPFRRWMAKKDRIPY